MTKCAMMHQPCSNWHEPCYWCPEREQAFRDTVVLDKTEKKRYVVQVRSRPLEFYGLENPQGLYTVEYRVKW